ncbi:hypothetical protein [Maribacter sp. HTCC2170]|uniref:hypothetical protein n=1 Tax=Maribacter sp. (strain HTCC2170 / KCCM 42371) TaxID=313603 RepID=UPI00006B4801|nr:hypothetical protein [Maribacter sp. HTCC2170]EAR01755.1 hypothetical protein FB2170_14543 [Maribacter sp. HTCC2170]
MKATAKIEKLNSDKCKRVIVRNLSRILEIKILEVDPKSNTLSFVYKSVKALNKVKRELRRIGFPIEKSFIKENTPEVSF